MKTLRAQIRPAILSTLVLAVVCCGVYPLLVFGVAQLFFPHQANGSLVIDTKGIVRGSELLAQGFTGDRYFHPRPSAAGANGYDAVNSGGSNLGPTSQKLQVAVKERIAAYRAENHLAETVPVPADAVTASGSGLDPHISPESARLQLDRVARARGLTPERRARLENLVAAMTEPPQWGILGGPRVNVLLLNLAVDRL